MLASAQAFFENIIDYAGMFPPAKLPMAEALQNYTRYAAGPDAWMLGRFVCTIAELCNLVALVRGMSDWHEIAVAGLGRSSHNMEEFYENFHADLDATQTFREACRREDC